MTKTHPFLEYIIYDIFGESEPITTRAMMGGVILYFEGKPFALVEDEELYFKGNKETKVWYLERGSRQFVYQKQGKDAHLYYFSVPQEVYEERTKREEWLGVALSVAALPTSKSKKVDGQQDFDSEESFA